MKTFAEFKNGKIQEIFTIKKSSKPNAFYNSIPRPSFNNLPLNHCWTSPHLISLAAKELGVKKSSISCIVETLDPANN